MAHALTNTIGMTSLSHEDGWLNAARKRVEAHMAYRRTLADLRSLSIDELEDLGFAGLPLERIAHRSVYGN